MPQNFDPFMDWKGFLTAMCDSLFTDSEYSETFEIEESELDEKTAIMRYFDPYGNMLEVNADTMTIQYFTAKEIENAQ